MSLCISNVCIPVLRSETEPLVLQFIYVFRDHDTFIVALICFTFIAIANTTQWLVFCVYMIPCSTTFVIFVQYLLYIILVLLFSR